MLSIILNAYLIISGFNLLTNITTTIAVENNIKKKGYLRVKEKLSISENIMRFVYSSMSFLFRPGANFFTSLIIIKTGIEDLSNREIEKGLLFGFLVEESQFINKNTEKIEKLITIDNANKEETIYLNSEQEKNIGYFLTESTDDSNRSQTSASLTRKKY